MALFRIAIAKEDILKQRCEFFEKNVLSDKRALPVFFTLIHKFLTKSNRNIHAISDQVSILLEDLLLKGIVITKESTHPIVTLMQ